MSKASSKKSSVDKVREHLNRCGVAIEVMELDESTRTAALAAEAVGSPLGAIVKSLVFLADGKPVLVLVAGDKRADHKKLEKILKARRVMIADADQVREATGFAIGGVPPVAHKVKLSTFIDKNLGRFETLYAAAGSPRAVFPISYEKLVEITGGQLADVTED
ncbi:MAG: YbaK/EbsC family protein [Chloroflexi bacterium]|nr:YbaK/EbsC family protein [Chloroflexota bacterium]